MAHEDEPVVVDPDDTSRDHYIEANNNKPSPHNLGWYSDFNAEQRYAIIVTSYMMVVTAIEHGDYETAIEDFSLWVVANAPADQEAIAAGAAYFEDNPQYMESYHDRIFGYGFTNLPTYETENIPKIPLSNDGGAIDLFNQAILQKLTDDPGMLAVTFDWQTDLGTVGNFLKDKIQDDPEWVEKQWTVPGFGFVTDELDTMKREEGTEYPAFGPAVSNLWQSSYEASHGPEYSRGWQQAQNIAADVPGFVVDMFVLGSALKMGQLGAGAVTSAIAKAVPSGLRNWIANGLVAVKNRGSSKVYGATVGRIPRRRTLALGNAAIAGTTALGNWGYQLLDNDENKPIPGLNPETQEFLSEMWRDNTPKGPVSGMLNEWMQYSNDQLDYMKQYDNEKSPDIRNLGH